LTKVTQVTETGNTGTAKERPNVLWAERPSRGHEVREEKHGVHWVDVNQWGKEELFAQGCGSGHTFEKIGRALSEDM